MPAVFFEAGWRFHFYSNEGDPREPHHIHAVKRGEGDAKLWLYPEVSIAYSHGVDVRIQRWLIAVVSERRQEIAGAWDEYFGSGN